MMPFLLLASRLALGHGGEDHGAPVSAPPMTQGSRLALSSAIHDAVLVADGTSVTLRVADAETSAPQDDLTITGSLAGPRDVPLTFEADGSGAYHAPAVLEPATWAGALVLTSPEGTDLLPVNGLVVAPPSPPAPTPHGMPLPWIVGTVGLTLAALLLGWFLGRRQRAALGLLLATAAAPRVLAHGGEDHGGADRGELAHAKPALRTSADIELPMESQFLLGLRTVRVARGPFEPSIRALGTFVAPPGGAAEVVAPVSGIVRASKAFPRPGDPVRAGDVLALIQEVPAGAERAALAQERAGAATRVEEARAALALAERDQARVQELGDALSPREVQERALRLEVARAAFQEAERALQVLEGGVTVPVKAPLSGRLAAVSARPGNGVAGGQALFKVVGDGALWLVVSVPELDALGIVAGAQAEVTVSGIAEPRPAVVLDAGQEADPRTGTVAVTLVLELVPGLKPGMAATAFVHIGIPRDALLVPDDAVVGTGGVDLVFVKTGPETFRAQALDLGGRSGTSWEVEAGLEPGERVVTVGTASLQSLAGR